MEGPVTETEMLKSASDAIAETIMSFEDTYSTQEYKYQGKRFIDVDGAIDIEAIASAVIAAIAGATDD